MMKYRIKLIERLIMKILPFRIVPKPVYCVILSVLIQLPVLARANDLLKQYIPGDSSQFALQPTNWLGASETRQVINLNGVWQAQLAKTSEWVNVLVPGIFPFQETVVFQRTFSLEKAVENCHFKLVAHGINYRCSIFMNDKFIGTHVGGFTSFSIDIDAGIIQCGQKNTIRIFVDNWLDARCSVPLKHNPFGWKNYGGIFRDIFLLATPKLMIDEFKYDPIFSVDLSECVLLGEMIIRNVNGLPSSLSQNSSRYALTLELFSNQTPTAVIESARSEFTLENKMTQAQALKIRIKNPRLWSPENPFLYQLRITLFSEKKKLDQITFQIGFRKIEIKNGNLFFNGKPFSLLGVNWHEWVKRTGFLVNYQTLCEEIALIKSLGANCVRVVGHPPHPYFLQGCSENGLLVLEEVPIRHIPTTILTEPGLVELAEAYLREMIQRDKNQACVLAWGVGHGLESANVLTNQYLNLVKNMINQIDARPIYAIVSAPHFKQIPAPVEMTILEPFALSEKTLLSLSNRIASQFPEKILFFSYGIPFREGIYQDLPLTKLELNHCYHLCTTLNQISHNTPASGIFINTFNDWHCEQPLTTMGRLLDPYLANYGLTTIERQKRLAFQHIAAKFTNDKQKPINQVKLTPPTTDFFVIVGIGLLLLFLHFYKQNRRLRVNISRSFFRQHGFITDIRENRKIPVFDTLLIGVLSVTTLASTCASIFFYFKNDFIFDQLLSLILINQKIKERIIHIIWEPLICTLSLIILFLIIFLFAVGLTKIFAKIFGKSLSFFKAFIFNIWMSSIYLFLIPFSIVLYRIMIFDAIRLPLLGLVGIIHLWLVVRVLKGLAVLLFVKLSHVLIAFIIISGIIWGAIGFYYQQHVALIDYLCYYF